VLVKNANRMMTSANPTDEGIELAFADGCRGLVLFADIREVEGLPDLVSIELPNPYELVLLNSQGETIDFPWDFARHYCDASYRPRVEAMGAVGRHRSIDHIGNADERPSPSNMAAVPPTVRILE